MRTKIIALLVSFMVLGFSMDALAYKVYHYREGDDVRAEAARRNVMIIPIARAQMIAAGRLGTAQVIFPAIELYDEQTGSSEFRPVYRMECVSANRKYIIVVDAANAKVLKCDEQD